MLTKETIEMLKEKSEKAFDVVWNEYSKLIFSVIYKITNDYEASKEIRIDTFHTIYKDIKTYRGGNFKYWCLSIAKNKANSYVRIIVKEKEKLKNYQKAMMSESDSYGFCNENERQYEQLVLDIKTILDQESYELVMLHLINGVKFRDIASRKCVSVNVILGKYHRAIKKIRKELDYEKYTE